MSKTYKIFGYGTLINEDSLRRTIPNAKNIIPVKLFGFIRVFNVKETKQITMSSKSTPRASLNIEKSEWNQYVNGVCFEIDEEAFQKLHEREWQYEVVQIEVQPYEDSNSTIKAYVFRALHYETYDFQEDSDAQEEYLQTCLDGAKNYGKIFLEHFKETTYIGEKTLKELDY